MINGIKLKDSNLSPNQRRIRLMELSGVPINSKDRNNLEPRNELLTESKEEDFDIDEFIDELNDEITLDEILGEMGYYDDEEDEETPILEINFNSKGYKEGRKLVDKLRRDLFKKLNNDELDDFVGVLKTSFGI
jgi:hypothetical protein